VADPGLSVSATNGRKHKVLDAGVERGGGHVLTLLDFCRATYRKIVLDAVHAVDAGHRLVQTGEVVHIASHDLDTLVRERHGTVALWVEDKGTDR
jgi:hypothetical protein